MASLVNRRSASLLAVVVVFAAVAAACGGNNGGAEGDDGSVTIGLVTSVSGGGSILAPPILQAAELAVDELNEAGGILGRTVKLEIGDDGTDARQAVEAWNSLVRQKNVDVVVSFENSANRDAGLTVATQANVPALYTSVHEGEVCNPIMYTVDAIANQQIEPMFEYLSTQRDAKRFFFVGADYVYPRVAHELAGEIAEDLGGEVAGNEFAPIGTRDWAPIATKVKQSNADVVLGSFAGGADTIAFIKQLQASGADPIITSTYYEENSLRAVGPESAGIITTAPYFHALDTPENEEYLDKLEQKFGDDLGLQTMFSVATYDAIHLYAQAVEEAGTTSTAEVLEALAGQSFTGPRGTVTLNRDRYATVPIYIGEAREDGEFDILKDVGPVEPADQCEPDPPFGRED